MTLLKAGLNGVGIFQAESTKDNDLSQGPQDFLGRHCGSDSYKQGKVRRGSKGKSKLRQKQLKTGSGLQEKVKKPEK